MSDSRADISFSLSVNVPVCFTISTSGLPFSGFWFVLIDSKKIDWRTTVVPLLSLGLKVFIFTSVSTIINVVLGYPNGKRWWKGRLLRDVLKNSSTLYKNDSFIWYWLLPTREWMEKCHCIYIRHPFFKNFQTFLNSRKPDIGCNTPILSTTFSPSFWASNLT